MVLLARVAVAEWRRQTSKLPYSQAVRQTTNQFAEFGLLWCTEKKAYAWDYRQTHTNISMGSYIARLLLRSER